LCFGQLLTLVLLTSERVLPYPAAWFFHLYPAKFDILILRTTGALAPFLPDRQLDIVSQHIMAQLQSGNLKPDIARTYVQVGAVHAAWIAIRSLADHASGGTVVVAHEITITLHSNIVET
jgi:hypothetical protein